METLNFDKSSHVICTTAQQESLWTEVKKSKHANWETGTCLPDHLGHSERWTLTASFLFSHNASWLLETRASTWEEEETKIFLGLAHDKLAKLRVAMATAHFVSSFVISTSSALYYNCATLPILPPTDKTNVIYSLRPLDGIFFPFFSPFYSERAQKTHKERTNNKKLNS